MSTGRRRHRRRRLTLESLTRIGLLIMIILIIILCIVLITKCNNKNDNEPVKVTTNVPQTTSPTDTTTEVPSTSTTDTTSSTDETTSGTPAAYGDTITDDGQVIVCVDAGHGGMDGGCVGAGDRLEKNDALSLAKMVQEELEALGAKVIMTRSDDTFIELTNRPAIANDAKADVLLSIHRNSYEADASVKGVEAWISQSNPANSAALSSAILSALDKVGISRNRGVKCGTQGNAAEDYAINSHSTMPSLILEFGFITNAEDNNNYDSNMRAYAKAIAKAIYDWVSAQ